MGTPQCCVDVRVNVLTSKLYLREENLLSKVNDGKRTTPLLFEDLLDCVCVL